MCGNTNLQNGCVAHHCSGNSITLDSVWRCILTDLCHWPFPQLSNLDFCSIVAQIQHPRSHLNRFDLVITPRHDYFALTPEGKEQVPQFMQRWITPQEPPDEHVVGFLFLIFPQSHETALWFLCFSCTTLAYIMNHK